jgi:hypothetical protein
LLNISIWLKEKSESLLKIDQIKLNYQFIGFNVFIIKLWIDSAYPIDIFNFSWLKLKLAWWIGILNWSIYLNPNPLRLELILIDQLLH